MKDILMSFFEAASYLYSQSEPIAKIREQYHNFDGIVFVLIGILVLPTLIGMLMTIKKAREGIAIAIAFLFEFPKIAIPILLLLLIPALSAIRMTFPVSIVIYFGYGFIAAKLTAAIGGYSFGSLYFQRPGIMTVMLLASLGVITLLIVLGLEVFALIIFGIACASSAIFHFRKLADDLNDTEVDWIDNPVLLVALFLLTAIAACFDYDAIDRLAIISTAFSSTDNGAAGQHLGIFEIIQNKIREINTSSVEEKGTLEALKVALINHTFIIGMTIGLIGGLFNRISGKTA